MHADNTALIATAGTVVSDATAPVFSRAPEVVLRAGTVSTSSVPVTLVWKAADAIRLSSVALTAPAVQTFSATTTGYAASARVGAARTWRLTARDMAGNTRAASATKVDVYLDGKRAGTLDLRSSRTAYRQAVWAKAFTGSARHTVTIKVLGTGGRPAVTVDGLVVR